MSGQADDVVRFTLNGRRYELSRVMVEARLTGAIPEVVRKHGVNVNGTWFPVRQAFEIAVGVPRSEFISHTARRHLAALGFEVCGEIESRTDANVPAEFSGIGRSDAQATPDGGEEWHSEANVQAALVAALAGSGWRVLSVANTATKERGVDVIAERDGRTVGVEVKGFPSRNYADPRRAGEAKRTAPSIQAGHWYAQAVLAAMRLHGKEPGWRSVIALPDFPRYRDLYAGTSTSLTSAGIEVWWVHANGSMDMP